MQGHALFTRQAGGNNPCPALDFTGGFNQFMAAAYNLTGQTVEEKFGAPFGEASSLPGMLASPGSRSGNALPTCGSSVCMTYWG